MAEIDTFGEYVRRRLDEWGREYALFRDCDYLGHKSKNMLQVLIEHKGEMPAKTTGYKPMEILATAQEIEDIVADLARVDVSGACAMRAYFCGAGRRLYERHEQANTLMAGVGIGTASRRQYQLLVEDGVAKVHSTLLRLRKVA